MPAVNRTIVGYSLMLLGTFFWGVTFVVVKEAVAETDVYSFLAWRFALAALVLAAIFPRRLRLIDRRTLRVGAGLGAVLAASYLAQTLGLQWTGAAQAGFITGLSVVLVPLLLPVLRRRWPGLRPTLAALLAGAGLAVITLAGPLVFNRGDAWVLGCAAAFAVYIILVGKFAPEFDAVAITVVQLATVAVLTAAAAPLAGPGLAVPHGWVTWRAILICALLATAFMYTVQNHYQRYLSEVQTAVIFAAEPIFAALAAWAWLGEALTPRLLLGGVLIVAGMLLAEARRTDHKSTKDTKITAAI
jgi:drug/metabolite transporter (DMT)-like permease